MSSSEREVGGSRDGGCHDKQSKQFDLSFNSYDTSRHVEQNHLTCK